MNLFEWADIFAPDRKMIVSQPVVDFVAAYRAIRDMDTIFDLIVAHEHRRLQRAAGRMAPAAILLFPPRHPSSPGSYSPDARARG